jgi:hypothetical protein
MSSPILRDLLLEIAEPDNFIPIPIVESWTAKIQELNLSEAWKAHWRHSTENVQFETVRSSLRSWKKAVFETINMAEQEWQLHDKSTLTIYHPNQKPKQIQRPLSICTGPKGHIGELIVRDHMNLPGAATKSPCSLCQFPEGHTITHLIRCPNLGLEIDPIVFDVLANNFPFSTLSDSTRDLVQFTISKCWLIKEKIRLDPNPPGAAYFPNTPPNVSKRRSRFKK